VNARVVRSSGHRRGLSLARLVSRNQRACAVRVSPVCIGSSCDPQVAYGRGFFCSLPASPSRGWLPFPSGFLLPIFFLTLPPQVPRLVADLHAALGRGVSTSEAKAWVRALDRLGEGLSREKLLEACLVRMFVCSRAPTLFCIANHSCLGRGVRKFFSATVVLQLETKLSFRRSDQLQS